MLMAKSVKRINLKAERKWDITTVVISAILGGLIGIGASLATTYLTKALERKELTNKTLVLLKIVVDDLTANNEIIAENLAGFEKCYNELFTAKIDSMGRIFSPGTNLEFTLYQPPFKIEEIFLIENSTLIKEVFQTYSKNKYLQIELQNYKENYIRPKPIFDQMTMKNLKINIQELIDHLKGVLNFNKRIIDRINTYLKINFNETYKPVVLPLKTLE